MGELQSLPFGGDDKLCHAGDVAAGRLMLETSPMRTGSSPAKAMIGIEDVPALAVCAAMVPPDATITSTLRRTSSATKAGRRS